MSYTTITRIDDQPPTYVRNLTVHEAYQAAMRPEMQQGPNRWHVMMYLYAKKQMEALASGQSIDIAWQDPCPNPEEETVRISIMRQAPQPVPQIQPQYILPPIVDQQQPDESPQGDEPAIKRTRTH